VIGDIDISLGDGLQESRLEEMGRRARVRKGKVREGREKVFENELTFPDPFSPRRPYLKGVEKRESASVFVRARSEIRKLTSDRS